MLLIKKYWPLIASLMLLLLLSACGPAHGSEVLPEDPEIPFLSPEISEAEIKEIISYMETYSDGEGIIIDTIEVLYDLNENPYFILTDIEPEGFAVWFRYPAIFMSESAKYPNPYASVSGTKYYGGALSHIYFDGEAYIDIRTGDEISEFTINRAKEQIIETYKRIINQINERLANLEGIE